MCQPPTTVRREVEQREAAAYRVVRRKHALGAVPLRLRDHWSHSGGAWVDVQQVWYLVQPDGEGEACRGRNHSATAEASEGQHKPAA